MKDWFKKGLARESSKEALPPPVRLSGMLLVCPDCGETNLHHGRVEIRNRMDEDEDGICVEVLDQSCSVNPETEFRGRRNDISIEFWCEHCEPKSQEPSRVLVLYQHKGSTYLEWVLL